MANKTPRYFSNAWGALSGNQEKKSAAQPDNDEVEVVYHSLSSKPSKPGSTNTIAAQRGQAKGTNNQLNHFQANRLPIPKLICTAPSISITTVPPPLDPKALETNITYSVDEFEMIARQTLQWYGFQEYLCVSTFQTWFKRYLEHVRGYSNRLCNCVDQIERDYGLASIHIPRQQAQEHTQERKPLYYGTDYLSVVFAKQNKSVSNTNISPLFGGISFGSNEQTIEMKMKAITTTLQQVLLDPSNGSLSIPAQLMPDKRNQGQKQDRNEENAYKDKWNPINCDIPFPIFVRHVQHRFETHAKKVPLPHFDIEIFRLRYVEHMAQAEKNDKLFLLAVVTAYGHDISTYPLRVMELLKRTKVFRPGSKPFNTDYGNHPKAFISIDLSNSQPKNDTLIPGSHEVNPIIPVGYGYSTVPSVDTAMQPASQVMPPINSMFSNPRPLLPPSQTSSFGPRNPQGPGSRYGNPQGSGPGYGNNQGPGFGVYQGSGYGNPGGSSFGNHHGPSPGYSGPQGVGCGNPGDSGYGNSPGPGYGGNRQTSGFGNAKNTNSIAPLMSSKVDSLYSIANDPTKVLRNPISLDEPLAKRIKTAMQNNKPPNERNNLGASQFTANPRQNQGTKESSFGHSGPQGSMNPNLTPLGPRPQGLMNSNFGRPPSPPRPMNQNFGPSGFQGPRNQNFGPPCPPGPMNQNQNFGLSGPQLPVRSNFVPPGPQGMNDSFGPSGPREFVNTNFGAPGPQGLMNSNFGPPAPATRQGMTNSVPPLIQPGPGYQMPAYNVGYSTQNNQTAPNIVNSVNGSDSVANMIPNQMKNLIRAAGDNSKRMENNPQESNSDQAKISFEMPFDIWKIACERARSNVHNQLSSAPLRRLSENEYKLWYARYLYHVEENYDNFLQGIISGFPPPNYPREIRDMITHRQLMEEGKCDRVRKLMDTVEEARFPNDANFEEEDNEDEDNDGEDSVLYDYGHSTSNKRQFEYSSFHNPVNPKSNSSKPDAYNFRKY